MAVEPIHAGRDALRVAAQADDFDDPTEDLADDPAERRDAGGERLSPGRETSGEGGASDPFEPGQVLCGRYQLERVVGRGGLSVVLAARDLRRQAAGDDDARVAVKVLRPELRRDDEARRRLTSEFRQLQQLSHPGIVRVYDLDRHGEDWFVVMELLEGVSLAGLMKHAGTGGIPRQRGLAIVQACAEALGWAHGRGLVHGDVKPGNVMVTRDDGVRLLDFGNASVMPQSAAPAEGGPAGFATPAYASPQVLQRREPVAADDLYSLACVTFELLSGEHPFDRLDAREASARGMHPGATPRLDPAMRSALEAGLAFDRERRPPGMAAFMAALTAPEPRTDVQPAAPLATDSQQRRPRGPWLVAAVLAAGLIAIVALRGGDPPAAVPSSVPGSQDRPLAQAGLPAESMPEAGEVPAEAVVAQETDAVEVVPRGDVPPAPAAAPAERQFVGFSSEALVVSRTAPAAAIPVHRSAGTNGRVIIRWRATEGSARAGRDFTGPLSGTLALADGQQGGTVFIPLATGAATTDDRSFAVTLDGVSGRAAPGAVTRTDVTLRSFVRDEPRNLAARD